MKQTIKLLQTYARAGGRDIQSVFIEMLDFFIESFSPELFIRFKGDMTTLFASRYRENQTMFEAMRHWLMTAEKDIAEVGISDFFGDLYESMFLGKSKSSAMGQFFTPVPLCQCVASLLQSPEAEIVGEPSCGSGRNVLAHWQSANKSKPIEYRCEDLDPTSVKMCALNMMINGIYGSVICHDSLVPTSFHFGYAINEIRFPIPSPFYSIRSITKK